MTFRWIMKRTVCSEMFWLNQILTAAIAVPIAVQFPGWWAIPAAVVISMLIALIVLRLLTGNT